MKKLLAVLAIGLFALFSTSIVFAWTKDSGATCKRVFASINNESESLHWDGTITANGNTVVNESGEASPSAVVTVEWFPPADFSGTVEAIVRLKKTMT
jgi:hypothetical protein